MEVVLPVLLACAALLLVAWGARRHPAAPASGHGAAGPAPDVAGPTLTVGTYNVGAGKGRDGVRDRIRAAAPLEAAGLDLVGLQEVAGPGHARALAAALGMGWLYAPAERRWFRAHRGNALLTRLPVGAWRVEPLPRSERGAARSVLTADVELGAGRPPLRVVVTHVARHADREAQLARVLERLGETGRAVLLGDLNADAANPALRAALDEGDVEAARPDAGRQIDWVLARGLEVVSARRVADSASDHDLEVAVLRLPGGKTS